jgi:hypothetical protein
MTVETLREQVRIAGIVEGNPPMLAFSRMLTRPDGKRKLHTQMVQILDAELLSRLRREVATGTEAVIVIETDWTKPDIPTILKDFSLIQTPLEVTL